MIIDCRGYKDPEAQKNSWLKGHVGTYPLMARSQWQSSEFFRDMLFYVVGETHREAATDCIVIFFCNQSRHRSVAGGFIAHQVLAGMHSDTSIVHCGATSGSWRAMNGPCRGRCEICSHSTDRAQLDTVSLIEEIEEYCKWSGRVERPDNVYAFRYSAVIAKARPVPKAKTLPAAPLSIPKPKPSSRSMDPSMFISDSMDSSMPSSGSMDPPPPVPSSGSMDPPMTPPPQMDSSALADQVSLLTREVERLRSEMARERSRSRRRRRSSTPRRRRRSSTPRRRRRSSSRSRGRGRGRSRSRERRDPGRSDGRYPVRSDDPGRSDGQPEWHGAAEQLQWHGMEFQSPFGRRPTVTRRRLAECCAV